MTFVMHLLRMTIPLYIAEGCIFCYKMIRRSALLRCQYVLKKLHFCDNNGHTFMYDLSMVHNRSLYLFVIK